MLNSSNPLLVNLEIENKMSELKPTNNSVIFHPYGSTQITKGIPSSHSQVLDIENGLSHPSECFVKKQLKYNKKSPKKTHKNEKNTKKNLKI